MSAGEPGVETRAAAMSCLADSGLDPEQARLTVLSRSWLGDTYRVRAPDRALVLKVFGTDLAERIANDPDSRFRTLAQLFPIAPFFRSMREATAGARAALGNKVPRVLAEGEGAGAARYALMEELDGHRLDADPLVTSRTRGLAAEVGTITRALHTPRPANGRSRAQWLEALSEVLHCVADHVARLRDGPGSSSHGYHIRVLRALDRLSQTDLGPTVHAHCDLHPDNLLWGDDVTIAGVVDFQLSCEGPAALDFRWLSLFDETLFAASYGLADSRIDDACWLGHFFDMMWQATGIVAVRRFTDHEPTSSEWERNFGHFEYLLRLCEDDELRRGAEGRRRAAMGEARRGVSRRPESAGREDDSTSPEATARVCIVVPTWNHFETTTRPCLASVRRFTDVRYRLVIVDNGSQDETRAELTSRERFDPRVRGVLSAANLGWAAGTLAGLRHVPADSTHVLLLNSDTVVSPGWIRKLLRVAGEGPAFVVASESPICGGLAPLTEPGTAVPAPSLPLREVLTLAAAAEATHAGRSREAAPSGFCLLFEAGQQPVVEEFLRRFDSFHRGRADWHAWWRSQGLTCRVALDCFVFHARGGSGGYYAYRRDGPAVPGSRARDHLRRAGDAADATG